MHDKPDYLTWSSQECLSPHAIACLLAGVTPTTIEPDPATQPHGVVPNIPYPLIDALDREDRLEFEKIYKRVYLVLNSAIESSVLSASLTGKLEVGGAIAYLSKIATSNNWSDSLLACEFSKLVLARLPDDCSRLLSDIEALQQKVSDMGVENGKLTQARSHSTLALTWLNKAVDKFYGDPLKPPYVGRDVADWIVSCSTTAGTPITITAAKAIARVITPDVRKKGGRPPSEE